MKEFNFFGAGERAKQKSSTWPLWKKELLRRENTLNKSIELEKLHFGMD